MNNRQVGKIEQAIGIAGFLYLIILFFYIILTEGKGPLVWPLFFIGIPTLVATALIVKATRTLILIRTIRAFESGLRINKGRLILPDNLKVELGLLNISGEFIVVAEQVYRGRRYRRRVYESEAALLNPVERATNTINLEELCSQPSVVYIDAEENRVIVEAPGFIVSSGRFKNIGVLCLDSSSLPKRSIELSTGDHADTARAVITSFGDHFEASLKWSSLYRGLTVTYDREQRVFRTSDGMVIKSIALGARLELCVQTYSKTTCTTILKLNEPGEKTVQVSLLKVSKTPVVFYAGVPLDHYEYGGPAGKRVYVGGRVLELGMYLKKRAPKGFKMVLGYRPGGVSFRLVLDRLGMPREAREITL